MESDFDEKAALKLCRNKGTPAGVLKTLVGKSVKVDRLIAKHPNADVASLYKLSGNNDKTTCENILESANIEKLLVARPAAISRMDDAGWFWLKGQCKRPDTPKYLVDWAINNRAKEKIACSALGWLWDSPLIPDEVYMAEDIESGLLKSQISEWKDVKARGEFLAGLGLDVKMIATVADLEEYGRCGYVMSLDGGKTYEGDPTDISNELTEYWADLVPERGDAQTVQGQFSCIIFRFTNEYWRNGLMNWVHQVEDDDYRYRGMVEFLQDRLVAEKPFNPSATARLADMLKQLFYEYYPAKIDIFHASDFETIIERLECAIYAYAKKFPELIPNDEAEKCDVARSRDIDLDMLEKLASDVSSKVRSVVASNPLCPVDVLKRLSADHSVQVRLAVARHEKLPIDAIEELSMDENPNVRCAAARRKDFPAVKRDDFISAQFTLIFGDTSKAMECSAQSSDRCRLPFDVWKPKLAELLARLGSEFFLEKLAALLEGHVDRRDGTKDDLWCCRRILYYISESKEAPLLNQRLAEKYPNIKDWDDYDEINELVKVVERRKTTSEELAGLIGIDVRIDRGIAKHRNATDEILKTLSNSADGLTRKNVGKRRKSG